MKLIIFIVIMLISLPAYTSESIYSRFNIQETVISSANKGEIIHKGTFECTAYDLSWQSCQKAPDDPWFGITADGTSLVNKTRSEAMAIAVDPKVIPLGSRVLIIFNGSRNKYTGIYKAVDTGGAIKGNKIDVFFGDFKEQVSKEAMRFGRVNAEVYLLAENKST